MSFVLLAMHPPGPVAFYFTHLLLTPDMLRVILILYAISSPSLVSGCPKPCNGCVCDTSGCLDYGKAEAFGKRSTLYCSLYQKFWLLSGAQWVELEDCNPPYSYWQNFTKNGLANLGSRWTNNQLLFKISGSFTTIQKGQIRIATANIERDTGGCVTLDEVSSAPGGNYVDVVNDGTGAKFNSSSFG